MRMPNFPSIHVTTFCCRCGYSLRFGSILIGICSMVASLLALVLALAWAYGTGAWAAGGDVRWAEAARARGVNEADVQTVLKDVFQRGEQLTLVLTTPIFVLLNLEGILEAFHCNFSAILLYGALKKKSSLVNLWVKYSILALVLRVLFLISVAIILMCTAYMKFGGLVLFLTIGSVAPAVYFTLVVNSYLLQLQHKEAIKAYVNECES